MAPPKPSLELLRALTDENVLRALMSEARLTRAEIAARTGISKPTISDSVQRLSGAGLVVDTGERTTGRGRVGSYYALGPDLGAALVAGVTQHRVTAEAVDALGRVRAREELALGPGAGPKAAADALATAASRLADRVRGGLRTAVISAADPVDRTTGRLVRLPDAPFLIGDLDPPAALAAHVVGPVHVDNDVNWAARAEHTDGRARDADDFVYLHLGEGLGGAVVSDGAVRRGHHGFVGEIAHLWTPGPDGTAMPLTEVFAALGLRRPGSTAIDVDALRTRIAPGTARADETRTALARAVGAVLEAAVSLVDPRLIVIGGEWGPDLVDTVADHFARSPRPVPVLPATLTEPELTGARLRAVEELRALIVSPTRPAHPTASD
ncbi:ROK family transcriptional regulator [Streptomyces longispororuber]|uniref:ROK family transcriptional regulator n=1 Tax=Streptomyces longispororuber TaxID=68230 RepID=UPI00210AC41E|nr:ROK family transcriptional regulator [Streptomyces longispororuber]MCQ4212616.1 ROK family transcriptional regulator [Streptomyces longispororuber]